MSRQIVAYRAARRLIGRHGARAETEARSKLADLAHKGALARAAAWWRILAAVQELQKLERTGGVAREIGH